MISDIIYSSLIQYNTRNSDNYIRRYIKLIEHYININSELSETHHILPKSIFPEYSNLKKHSWNSAKLPIRIHYIAHFILWKIIGGKMAYAFLCMTKQYGKNDIRKCAKVFISSKSYEKLKVDSRTFLSDSQKGKFYAKDSNGTVFKIRRDDPRFVSKELISLSAGRKYKPRTAEQRNNTKLALLNSESEYILSRKESSKNKLKKLYFMEICIKLKFSDPRFVLFLEQGWCLNQTKEYRKTRTAKMIEFNKKRTREQQKEISAKVRMTKLKNAKSRKWTTERRINQRKYKNKTDLYYNKETSQFENVDILFLTENHIKVFTRRTNCRLIFDESGNKRFFNGEIPILPPGYRNSHKLK